MSLQVIVQILSGKTTTQTRGLRIKQESTRLCFLAHLLSTWQCHGRVSERLECSRCVSLEMITAHEEREIKLVIHMTSVLNKYTHIINFYQTLMSRLHIVSIYVLKYEISSCRNNCSFKTLQHFKTSASLNTSHLHFVLMHCIFQSFIHKSLLKLSAFAIMCDS